MRYGIPAMLESGGGSIINTSSIAGLVAFAQLAPYCASKGAVLMMTTATVALFLASDDSSYVTGIAVPVDGGYTSL